MRNRKELKEWKNKKEQWTKKPVCGSFLFFWKEGDAAKVGDGWGIFSQVEIIPTFHHYIFWIKSEKRRKKA